MLPTTIICTGCNREFPPAEFDDHSKWSGRKLKRCKRCHSYKKRDAYMAQGLSPQRKCHDCPTMTTDYRCPKCLKAWRIRYGVSADAVACGSAGPDADGCDGGRRIVLAKSSTR